MAVLNFDLTRSAAHRTLPVCPPPEAEFDPSLLFDTTMLDALQAPLVRPGSSHLREKILSLVHAFAEGDDGADAVTSALLKRLLAELLYEENENGDSADRLIARMRRHIRLYASEITGNEALGQLFGYHPVYLAALFRQKTGETLHHAILAERIALAKQWLTRTDHSIEEIAADTGFSSRSHFCTAFKSFTGISPRRYRAQRA